MSVYGLFIAFPAAISLTFCVGPLYVWPSLSEAWNMDVPMRARQWEDVTDGQYIL